MNHAHDPMAPQTRVPATEGYAPPRRFRPGDLVPIHAASRVGRLDIRIRRSPDDTVYWQRWNVEIDDHPVPDDAWAAGCDWPIAFEIPTGPHWPAGLYLVDFLDGDGSTRPSPAWFVLGERSHPGRPMLVLSTNTWNAYNQWGGRCTYTGAATASFERPMEPGYAERPLDPDGFSGRIVTPTHDPEHGRLVDYLTRHRLPLWTDSSGWFGYERRFVAWAEAQGWRFDFALDTDLHRDPGLLDLTPLLLTVGHSEYWTWEMRDHVDEFVDRGGNWAVLSGNTCFWQVRLDGTIMTAHKGRARRDDPVGTDSPRLTSIWSDPLIGRPENATTGLSFTRGGYHRVGQAVPRGAAAFTVHRPDHWMLAGTDLRLGDQLGADGQVVGYEVDGCSLDWTGGVPRARGDDGTPEGFEVVGTAPARLISIDDDVNEAPAAIWADVSPPGDLQAMASTLFGDASPDSVARLAHNHAVLGSFTRGAGTVVNVGTTDWVHGLGRDRLIEQVTTNILHKLSN